jgi:hypothetical protein
MLERAGAAVRLFQDDARDGDGYLRKVTIEYPTRRDVLTFRSTARLPKTMDSAVIAVLFRAMEDGSDIHVDGSVSKPLLENLDEFQQAWAGWFNVAYTPVEIRAVKEISARPTGNRRSVVAFSGGVDATFSMWRHKLSDWQFKTDLQSALLVHGFDLPLHKRDEFAIARKAAEAALRGTGVDLHVVETNMRSIRLTERWPYNFGAALASCLHLLSSDHDIGLVGSDEPYTSLVIPWGSNPITNHFLSSGRFAIRYDGGGFSRTDKVSAIASWPHGTNHLRVCWEGPKTGKNCCRCEKCIRTILNFRAVGFDGLPKSFETDVTDDMIRAVKLVNKVQRSYMEDILRQAEKNGIAASWVGAVRDLLAKR